MQQPVPLLRGAGLVHHARDHVPHWSGLVRQRGLDRRTQRQRVGAGLHESRPMCGVLHRVREHQRLFLAEVQSLRTEQAGERHGEQRGGAGAHKADAVVFLACRAVVVGAQPVRFQAHMHPHGEGVQITGVLFRELVLNGVPLRIEVAQARIAVGVHTGHGNQGAEPPGLAGLCFTDGLRFHDQFARARERDAPSGTPAVSAVDRGQEATVMGPPIVAPCKRNGR